MAVTSVKERFQERASERNETTVTAVRVFVVETDDIDDGPEKARLADDIPKIRSVLPSNPVLACKSVRSSPLGNSPFAFLVTCSYETNPRHEDWPDNPLDQPMDISWSTVSRTLPIVADINGNPIVNSSYEPFDPPLEEEVYDDVLSIERNESSFDPAIARTYKRTVNAQEFYGAGKGNVKCKNISAVAARETYTDEAGNDIVVGFWRVSYEFHFRGGGQGGKDSWKRSILDQGFYEYENGPENSFPRNITDSQGNPISAPVLLNGNGGILGRNKDPVYMTFELMPESDFRSLNLE